MSQQSDLSYLANQLANVLRSTRETVTKASSIGINVSRWKGIIEYLDFVVAVLQGAKGLSERFAIVASSPGILPDLFENLIMLPRIPGKGKSF